MIDRILNFIIDKIWLTETNILKVRRTSIYRFIKPCFVIIKRIKQQHYSLFASALTTISLLTLVPTLAFIFALAKGLGFHHTFYNYIVKKIASFNEQIQEIFSYIFDFVNKTNTATLGIIGLIITFWGAINLMTKIEQIFNIIFEVSKARTIKTKVFIYSLFFIAIGSLTSAGSLLLSSSLINKALASFTLGHLQFNTYLAKILALLIFALVFTTIYKIIPNRKISFRSAFIGGTFVAICWSILQLFFTHSQLLITSYNKIYGIFALLPIFLIWLYGSWFLILIGAEISYTHQRIYLKNDDSKKLTSIALDIILDIKLIDTWKINNYILQSSYNLSLIHIVIKKLQDEKIIINDDNYYYNLIEKDVSIERIYQLFS